MFDDELEFDSDELGVLTLDWADIRELQPRAPRWTLATVHSRSASPPAYRGPVVNLGSGLPCAADMRSSRPELVLRERLEKPPNWPDFDSIGELEHVAPRVDQYSADHSRQLADRLEP